MIDNIDIVNKLNILKQKAPGTAPYIDNLIDVVNNNRLVCYLGAKNKIIITQIIDVCILHKEYYMVVRNASDQRVVLIPPEDLELSVETLAAKQYALESEYRARFKEGL